MVNSDMTLYFYASQALAPLAKADEHLISLKDL